MELEEDGFAQLFVEAMREFGRAAARREMVQRVVECVEAGTLLSDCYPSDICRSKGA